MCLLAPKGQVLYLSTMCLCNKVKTNLLKAFEMTVDTTSSSTKPKGSDNMDAT